ncbi:MAG: hypothetical protein AB1546_03720, partial [bacterium]
MGISIGASVIHQQTERIEKVLMRIENSSKRMERVTKWMLVVTITMLIVTGAHLYMFIKSQKNTTNIT